MAVVTTSDPDWLQQAEQLALQRVAIELHGFDLKYPTPASDLHSAAILLCVAGFD